MYTLSLCVHKHLDCCQYTKFTVAVYDWTGGGTKADKNIEEREEEEVTTGQEKEELEGGEKVEDQRESEEDGSEATSMAEPVFLGKEAKSKPRKRKGRWVTQSRYPFHLHVPLQTFIDALT